MQRCAIVMVWVVVRVMSVGCVTVRNANNYEPQDGGVSSAYYECLSGSQQGHMSVNRFGGIAGAKTNDSLLCACMASKGYSHRKATQTELAMGWIFSPVWVPLRILS